MLVNSMAQRKVIPQGKGGLTVYLPKSWVDKRGLKGGDLVDINEIEGDIVIGSKKSEHREYVIELTLENIILLRQILVYPYRMGFDTIVLKGECLEIIDEVQEIVTKYLLGFEVTSKSAKQIVIESISEPDETKFETLLRRLFLIIQEHFTVLVQSLEQGNFDAIKRVTELNLQCDKYAYFCKRAIKKEKYTSKILIIWQLLNSLQQINHSFTYLYQDVQNTTVTNTSIFKLQLSELNKYFNSVMDGFYKKNLKLVAENYPKRNELLNKSKTQLLLDLNSSFERIFSLHLLSIIRQIAIINVNSNIENYLEED